MNEWTLLHEWHCCSATLLHEWTILHDNSFAQGDTFAREDTFSRRLFCKQGHFCTIKIFHGSIYTTILLHNVTFLSWHFSNAIFWHDDLFARSIYSLAVIFFSQYRIWILKSWKLKFYSRLISKTKNLRFKF